MSIQRWIQHFEDLLTIRKLEAVRIANALAILFSAVLAASPVLARADSPAPSPQAAPVDSSQQVSRVTKYPELEARLKTVIPDHPIDDIRPSPIPGVFAVISGRSIIYVDASGKYVINGHLFDAATKQDLSVEAIAEVNRVDTRILPLADSFSEVKGNGKRQLYVFSDPDCPYCKKLETEFPKLTDVTIHVFLFPLVSLHPNAKKNAIAVWCSQDRQRAWNDKMTADVVPPAASCDNPVDRNLALAEKLGINGTPTLIFEDGKMVPGALSAARIDAMLGAEQ
jgi:thiol:disulfide interchange protein DsbC